ncbi:hypothetical protein D3C73_1443490 [compost metagenome]
MAWAQSRASLYVSSASLQLLLPSKLRVSQRLPIWVMNALRCQSVSLSAEFSVEAKPQCGQIRTT